MVTLRLYDNRNTYHFVKGTIIDTNTTASDEDANNTSRQVIFKFCSPFYY